MFQEQTSEVIGFDSSWKNEKHVQDQNLQTSDFSTKDQYINTTDSNSIQIQTDPIEVNTEFDELQMERLAKWLKTLYPKIVDELNDNSLNNAMAACQYLDMSASNNIVTMQELNIMNSEKTKDTHISALSWNCTGNTIAVACSMKHDVWCYHQNAEIKLYTFNRKDTLPLTPNEKLTCRSCVTSLAFHPSQPSILGAGTVSGEVYLWNITNENTSTMFYNIHEDRISLVTWVTLNNPKTSTFLVSSSLDAHLIFWKIGDSGLNIHEKYKPQQYTHKSYTGSADVIPKKTERGIINFDFSIYIPGLFIVAMEGGFILKCSLLGAKSIPSGNKITSHILDPYVSSYENHEGEILTLEFSPHRKDLFLSNGTDGQIKIFNIDQESPVQIIFIDVNLSSVMWIFCEPKLLVGASEDGSLRLFSLLNGQQIKTNAIFKNEALTSMAINHRRINLLAVGNDEGILTLWSIPWNNIAAQDNRNVFSQ